MINSDEGMYGGATYEEHLMIEFLRVLADLRIVCKWIMPDNIDMIEKAGMYEIRGR